MFERDIIRQLSAWKMDVNRKPLVIHGARQVGKTWALKYFGKVYFEDVAYFSLDKDESGLCDIFKTTKDPRRIIQQLSFLHGKKINPQTTLLILDEIQECNEALNALKYFCEEAPEYAVACAGSLLGIYLNHIGNSFPVGKVNHLSMYPLTFTEFLKTKVGDHEGGPALGVSQLLQSALGTVGGGVDALIGLFHAHLLLQQLAQHTEGQAGLGGGAGLGNNIDGEALALAQADDIVQVSGADAVAAEVDLGAALQLVVELALHGLHHGTGAQIAAADAGHDQHVGILTDLFGSCLDAGKLFLVIITGQIHPAQEVVARAGLCFQLLVGCFHLGIDGCIFLFVDKAGEVLRVQCNTHCIRTSKRFAGHFALRGNYLGISVPFPPGKVKVKILGFHTILIVFFCFFIQICSGRQFLRAGPFSLLCAEAYVSVFQPVRLPHSRLKAVPKSIRGASAAAFTSYSPSRVSPWYTCTVPTVWPFSTGASSCWGL